ncbi:hypothetical protein B0H10DRAFT_1949376 [Mycena sp. CBHHK59/15]|nr:hypothetical protein B0H10DRAFT_1949376 [Mycena sp. CBHHK59/15]
MYRLSLATMEPWIPDDCTEVLGHGLTSTCRYFNIGNTHPNTHVNFANHIDPHGTLKKLLNDRVADCMPISFIVKDPAISREDDIVEMGFALVGFKMAPKDGRDRYTCKLVLRTLMSLDQTASINAGVARNAERGIAPRIKATRNKRSVEVDEEDSDVANASRRIAVMRVTTVDVNVMGEV